MTDTPSTYQTRTRRPRNVTTRFSEAEYAQLSAAATDANLALADWFRRTITLERLDFNGYRASPPRTIQSVHSRYIVFEDGAHLTFPRRDEFDSREDFILWGRLAYRIGIAEKFQQP
jgi:hypothetical protein